MIKKIDSFLNQFWSFFKNEKRKVFIVVNKYITINIIIIIIIGEKKNGTKKTTNVVSRGRFD